MDRKIIAPLISLTSLVLAGCQYPGSQNIHDPLMMVFPSKSLGGKISLEAQAEQYFGNQEMRLDDGTTSKTESTDIGFPLRIAYHFTENLHFGSQLQSTRMHKTIDINIQYDLVNWSDGKFGLGAMVGLTSAGGVNWGLQAIIAQEVFKSNDFLVTPFLATQFRRSGLLYREVQNESVFIVRAENNVEVTRYALTPMLGFEITFGDLKGVSFYGRVAGGWDHTLSHRTVSEEFAPSNYSRGDGPLYALAVGINF